MRPRRYLVEADARAGLVALALLLAIPAVGAIFTDHAARSKWENRKLAEFPTSIGVRDDAKPFFGDLERFLDDHFGLAVPINRLYRRLVYFVFRDSPAREVTRGLDGFLFFNPGAGGSKRYSAFQTLCLEATDPAVIDKAWRSWISSLRRFRQQGYRVGVAIAPSKQVIYPEKLPDSVPRIYREACSSYAGRPSLARKLVEEGAKRGLHVVYPIDEFREHRYEGNFYPREQFHILDHAAHVLGLALLRDFRMDPPPSYFAFRDDVVVSNDLTRFIGFPFRISTRIYDYATARLQQRSRQPGFVTEYYERAHQWGTITSPRSFTRRSALIIANSFGRPTAKHLAPAYRSVVWINVNDLRSEESDRFFAELVPRIDPDDLIFVLNDTVAAQFHTRFPEAPAPPDATP